MGETQGLLNEVPTIDIPKDTKGMRGRPLVAEEFERMLAATRNVVSGLRGAGPLTLTQHRTVESWVFYLRGLWASGLRLTESLKLRWDEAPGALVVDLSGRRPMFRIPAESEKGGTHRLLPITPEFARLLNEVPKRQRRGRVFRPMTKSGERMAPSRHGVGPRVTDIGEAAGIITAQRDRKGETVTEFASAHDLRRSFGFRWSRRVMPAILKELMRHATVETTMKYYVGTNAEATADELWRAEGNSLGNSGQNGPVEADDQNAKNPCF